MGLRHFTGILFMFLLGCSSLELAPDLYACQQLDWFELGRSDGVRGEDALGWKIRKDSCEGFLPEFQESYMNGWYTGTDEFCSIRNAFAYGQSGQSYKKTCPKGREPAFLLAYSQGLKIHNFENENRSLSEEIKKINLLASSSLPQAVPPLLKKLNELKEQRQKNRREIASIKKSVEPSLTVTR